MGAGLLALIVAGSLGAGERPASSRAVSPRSASAVHLPFPPGVSYRVLFGPKDPPHHLSPRNRYAFDFAMPPGSEVSAAAAGTVVRAEGRFSGPTGRSQDNNFIAIRRRDGTVLEYHHLMKDGVLVRVGERVRRGEVIGFSGQSGKAEGPHLHFVLVRDGVSLPVRFHGLERGPVRGELCTSANVPPSFEERYERAVDVVRALRALVLYGAPRQVQELLVELWLAEAPAARSGASGRRSLLAQRAWEREVRAEIASILDTKEIEP